MPTQPISIRLPADLLAWITKRAKAERRAVNAMIRLLLEDAFADAIAAAARRRKR